MKRIPKEDRAGLYLTVIIHLAVVIVLLLSGLGYSLSSENSFVLDFSKYEDVERLRQELAFKEEISRKLQARIEESGTSTVRNVAVDRAGLKDDRGTDADKLYEDAQRLQEELDNGFQAPKPADEQDYADPAATDEKKDAEKKDEKPYAGPSVVSYDLAGRKASRLSIPAYRCMGGGEVTVLITVNPAGSVIGAKIDESVSAEDPCLRAYATRAARLSKFSAKSDAAPKQGGSIVYRFIAQ